METPRTALEAYKAIIDGLISETQQSLSSRLIREKGIYTKAPDYLKYNDLVKSLTTDQKEMLAEMFQHEREDAIHDVLAKLTWWIICHKVGLTFSDEPMPVDLSGMGLHGDYVGRKQGWEWPSD